MKEEKNEEKTTIQLIAEFNLVAILTPLIILGGIYLYTYFSGSNLTKSQWKQIIFIIWAGVIVMFLREIYKIFRNCAVRKNLSKHRKIEIGPFQCGINGATILIYIIKIRRRSLKGFIVP